MMPPQALLNAKRLKQLALLAFFLTFIYLFTYSGRIESGDTRTLFNATSSFVQYGDFLLDKTAWYNQPESIANPSNYFLGDYDAEPLQIVMAAPLYWLAEHVPGIGLVHTVWLLNTLVCTLVCAVMYLYALALGYSEKIAIFVSLALGLTSIFWPYSKSFFREPLAALLIFLGALALERCRRARYRDWKWLVIAVVSLVGAMLTKDAIVLALPALVMLVLPSIGGPLCRNLHRVMTAMLVLSVVGLIFLFVLTQFLPPDFLGPLYPTLSRLVHQPVNYMPTAMHTYLLSIGGSVWATSPLALLAVPGIYILYRRRQYRYILTIIMMLFGFATGYALLRGVHWFGGLSWPPRFLIPVVPFLFLGMLPFLDRVFRQRRAWQISLVMLLVVYGLWIQIAAVSLDWGAYNAALPPEANGLGEWGGGLNLIAYLRWVLIPTLWSHFPIDFVWVRTGLVVWPLACVIGAVVCGVWLWRTIKTAPTLQPDSGRAWMPLIGLALATVTGVFFGLRLIYVDTEYLGDQTTLFNTLPIIQSNGQPNDVLLLANNNYEPFFLNYDKTSTPRVIAMPDQPGDAIDAEQNPQILAVNPDGLLHKNTMPFMFNLAASHDRLWMLADSGPWIPSAVRPLERFLVTHFYPIRELSTDPPNPRIRLIEFSTVSAPDSFSFRGPDQKTDLRYGNSIHLIGFTLPSGTTYQAGDVLPLSLNWQPDAPIEQNYTVAWFVVDSDGVPVVQGTDTQPAWNFAPTSRWQPGDPVWDNRALRLPSDMKPGVYHIWVRLYFADPSGNLQILPVIGSSVVEDTIGVLPIEITVSSG